MVHTHRLHVKGRNIPERRLIDKPKVPQRGHKHGTTKLPRHPRYGVVVNRATCTEYAKIFPYNAGTSSNFMCRKFTETRFENASSTCYELRNLVSSFLSQILIA